MTPDPLADVTDINDARLGDFDRCSILLLQAMGLAETLGTEDRREIVIWLQRQVEALAASARYLQ